MNLMMITTLFWALITPEIDLHMGIFQSVPLRAVLPLNILDGRKGAYKH